MAKKRKKEEEEHYDFVPPEFDKAEFMRKEIKKAKAAVVTIVYAIVIAIASFGLTVVSEPALGAVLGFSGLALIYFVFQLAMVDIKIFEKKDWAGNAFIYVFTWLGIWILLMNPPFSDFAHPTIEGIHILGEEGGQWVRLNETNEHYLINDGENVTINATITDNVEVSEVWLEVQGYTGTIGEPTPNGHVYSWLIQDVQLVGGATNRTYLFTIHAVDVNDNAHSVNGEFIVRQ